MTDPLFTDEGPEHYGEAFAHNRPFATEGPYQTMLPPEQEEQFRQWVAKNKVPFDPEEDPTDYDMRGYWQAQQAGEAEPWTGPGSHFPDTFKTPYDTTFSGESMYAKPETPFEWQGDNLIDTRDGSVIFAPPKKPEPESAPPPAANPGGYGSQWRLGVQRIDGTISALPITMAGMADGHIHWNGTVALRPGERVVVITS